MGAADPIACLQAEVAGQVGRLVAERDAAQAEVRRLLLKLDEAVPADVASGMRWRIVELWRQVAGLLGLRR